MFTTVDMTREVVLARQSFCDALEDRFIASLPAHVLRMYSIATLACRGEEHEICIACHYIGLVYSVCVLVYVSVSVHLCVYLCLCVCVCVCICVCLYVCVYVNMCLCLCVWLWLWLKMTDLTKSALQRAFATETAFAGPCKLNLTDLRAASHLRQTDA